MHFYEHLANEARAYLIALLQANSGNAQQTAKDAGLNRTHLYTLMRALGIRVENHRPEKPPLSPDPTYKAWIRRTISHKKQHKP